MANSHPIPKHKRFEDLTGMRFTRWAVEGYDGYRGGHHFWQCRCDCGKTRSVAKGSLLKGVSLSCGCLAREKNSKAKLQDLTGKVFGRLTVSDRAATGNIQPHWRCVCECGTEKVISGASLRRGLTSSCGCLAREQIGLRARTHGMVKSPEFGAWSHMRRRCNNPNDAGYAYYGGRGIRVCAEWDASFEAFFADMGPRPSPVHSIDRIDNDGNYEAGNCRWATKSEQAFNRRPKGTVKPRGTRVKIASDT